MYDICNHYFSLKQIFYKGYIYNYAYNGDYIKITKMFWQQTVQI